jgi:hypothetical protein
MTFGERLFSLRISLLACGALCWPALTIGAQSESPQRDPVAILREIVPLICGNFEISGSSKTFTLSGDAKAHLANLFKKLADLGIAAAGNLNVEEYTGVLRTEIAPQLSGVRECRLKVWADLKSKLFPGPESSLSLGEQIKNIRIGVTSIDNVISNLGTPTNRIDNLARYDKGGYVLFIHHEDKGNLGNVRVPGAVKGMAFVPTQEADPKLALDGHWNRKAWCREGDRTDECRPIVAAEGFGTKTLAQSLASPDQCAPIFYNSIGDLEAVVRVVCGDWPQIAIYLGLWNQDLQEADLERDKIYKLYKALSPTLEPDPDFKFAPPRPRGLDEIDENRKAFMNYIGKLRPARMEVGEYKADYAGLDDSYEDFHRAQDFGTRADETE